MSSQLRAFFGFARALRSFLSETLPPELARQQIEAGLRRREAHFLRLLNEAVFSNGRSPYRALLSHAGVERGDVSGLVADQGLEGALATLYDAGVRLSLGEARGTEPLRRGSLELWVSQGDLENPVGSRHWEGRSGGSRSAGTRFWTDLAPVEEAASYFSLLRQALGLADTDAAMWRSGPPGVAGIRIALGWTKAGTRLRRWFAPTVPRWRPGSIRHAAFTAWITTASRRYGRPIPAPELMPLAAADRVAGWMEGQVRAGRPAMLISTPSSGARVCRYAIAAGLDLRGSFFFLGGEPHTEAKASLISAAGARAMCGYFIAELGGAVALPCADAHRHDEMHVAENRLAVLSRRREVLGGSVEELVFTSLSPAASPVAINLESGDYASLERRACGCLLGELGLSLHAHNVRSYEKLSTEGMHFLGPDLITLLEVELPRRFGGGPGDYQLIEEEGEDAVTSITLAASPRIGVLDEDEVGRAALDFLRSRGVAEGMMADVWKQARSVRVARREPVSTTENKILPLHVSRPARTRGGPRAAGGG